MMETLDDDDIFILRGQDTVDGSTGDNTVPLCPQDFVISRGSGGQKESAVQALQQAYTDLKKRYNEAIQQKQQYSRVIRSLKGSDFDMASYGNGDSFTAHGAAATGENVCPDDIVRVQQGYIKHLLREKVHLEANSQRGSLESLQAKLKDTVSNLKKTEEELRDAQGIIHDLKTENMDLREERVRIHRHASEFRDQFQESMQLSMEKQSKEYDELKQNFQKVELELKYMKDECDRLRLSESLAKDEIKSLQQKVCDWEEQYKNLEEAHNASKEQYRTSNVDGMVPSLQTTREMDYLKKVIADLRNTVVHQRFFFKKLADKVGAVSNVKTDNIPALARQEEILESWENVPRLILDPNHVNKPGRKTRASDGAIDLQYRGPHSSSEVHRRKPSAVENPRSKSEIISRSPDMSVNDPRMSQVTNSNNMMEGSAGYHSVYDNMGSVSRLLRKEVVADFGHAKDETPAFPVSSAMEGSAVDPCTPFRDTAVEQESSGARDVDEKICPVCTRNFSAMTIEDFQSHVFECFDDHSAPETLRPANQSQNDRMCPMCNKLFSENIPQDDFEKHVQTHFDENIGERFEILEP